MSTAEWWLWTGVVVAVCLGSLAFGYLYGRAKARQEASLEIERLEREREAARPPESRSHRGPSNIDLEPSRVTKGRMRQKRRNWSR